MGKFSSYTWIPDYSKSFFSDYTALRVTANRIEKVGSSMRGNDVRLFLVPNDKDKPDVQVVSLDSVEDLRRFALDVKGWSEPL